MMPNHTPQAAATEPPSSRRLFVYSGGFLRERRLRRILQLSGWHLRLGRPGPEDHVAVWGQSPTAHRGESMAAKSGATLLRIEDAFLRSVKTGRSGDAPMGLLIDAKGAHFDPAQESTLEAMLARDPLDNHAKLSRARDVIDRLRYAQLSKYNDFDLDAGLPTGPYVLVIDQTRDDASVLASRATPQTFREMLVIAQEEHPGLPVIVKSHPETQAGHRLGYYGDEHETGNVRLLRDPVSPWALLEGAVAVYTVSSGMGFEAILAGHKPRVFGQPFYAGWGLTQDENPLPRRQRKLTRAQLVAAALIDYPTWYDPSDDRLCEVEDVLGQLEARARAAREDRAGYVATGMRAWKRRSLLQFYGQHGRLSFARASRAQAKAAAMNKPLMSWAGKAPAEAQTVYAVEDGFIRSRGLGAALTPPLSLVRDDLGIYYDPTRESRLETLIAASARLPAGAQHRAEALINRLTKSGISKYNLGRAATAELPPGHRILVPGQVEDDASIRLGTSAEKTNLDLLRRVRTENPDAVVIYKPHPDVEAGLRDGTVPEAELHTLADAVAHNADAVALINAVDEVWTLTSTLGFEALLRGKSVTCLGAPFYAGWGLTRDLGPVPSRRSARPEVAGLVHATLIDYPRYHDPVQNAPCPVETILDRIEAKNTGPGAPSLRLLSKLQGLLAPHTRFWR